MSGPNPFLSEFYDTAKVAEAEYDSPEQAFVKLALDQGVDLESMTDSEVADLYMKFAQENIEGASEELADAIDDEQSAEIEQASDALANAIAEEAEAEAGEGGGGAEPPPTEEEVKEAQRQFAQADFLGRTMAHAMVQELNELQKEAVKHSLDGMAPAGLGKSRLAPTAITGEAAALKDLVGRGWEGGKKGLITAGKKLWEHKGKAGIGLGVAGLGAGGYALAKHRKGKSKEGSADLSADMAVFIRTAQKLNLL